MAVTFATSTVTVGADVASPAGTIEFPYPAGLAAADFADAGNEILVLRGLMDVAFEADGDFSITYGGSSATITYLTGTTIPAGSVTMLQMPLAEFADLPVAVGTYDAAEQQAIIDRVNSLLALSRGDVHELGNDDRNEITS